MTRFIFQFYNFQKHCDQTIAEMETSSNDSHTREPHTNINSFVYAGVVVNVDMTDALAVAQHRNTLSRPLDGPDQLGRAPWNDQVDQLVEPAQILDFFTCAHLHTKVHFIMSKNI